MSPTAQKSELSSKIGNSTGRGGADSDMASSILFLVSPAGLFYNNQLLHPEGGQMLNIQQHYRNMLSLVR